MGLTRAKNEPVVPEATRWVPKEMTSVAISSPEVKPRKEEMPGKSARVFVDI
jgi:hypothetical protein